MFTLQTETETQEFLVPQMALSSIQYWWDAISTLTRYFFEKSGKFRPTMTPTEMAELVVGLENIRRTIASVACPDLAADIRQELMDAMSSTLLAISGAISKRPETVQQHATLAKTHLDRFNALLDELGLS